MIEKAIQSAILVVIGGLIVLCLLGLVLLAVEWLQDELTIGRRGFPNTRRRK